MTDLGDLAEAFKREVAVPGTFATAFPSMSDDDIVGSLADAFGEAQLDGFFGTLSLDVDAGLVDPDLSVAGAALVVMYAGMRLIRQQLRGMKTRYKAGPVEVEQSASALTEELKQIERRRIQVIQQAVRAGRGYGSVFVLDAYVSRAASYNYYGGFFAWELTGGPRAVGGAV